MRQPRFFYALVFAAGLFNPVEPLWAQPAANAPGGNVTVEAEEDLRFLRNPALKVEQRAARVRSLLNERGDKAQSRLIRVLREGETEERRALLQAVGHLSEDGVRPFLPALFPMLASEDDVLRTLTVEAVARFDEPAARRRLASLATERKNPIRQRTSAIHALAHHPRREVVAALMALIHDDDRSVQDAAYAALRTLTGREDMPNDPAPWSRWWRRHSELTAAQWQQALLRTLVEGGRRAAGQRQHLEGRLAETLRLLYLEADSERRDEFLIAWLDDPLPAIRDLAMDLVAQRLVDVGAEPVREPLRVALRHALGAPHTALRRRAADALRQFGDPRAAALVAGKLSEGVEHDAEVLRAYLRLLRQVPQREAIEPVIQWLGDTRMARPAADALTAALDAGEKNDPWITPQQAATMRNIARRHLAAVNDETPSMIRLLGRIAAPGADDDWQLVAGFLDSEVDLVRDAAARAWAASNQPLAPLATRAADGVIQPFLYDAAIRRGADPRTFLALADHPPSRPSLASNREQALVALAAKVNPEAVLQVADQFVHSEEDPALRVSLLAAALLTAEAKDPMTTDRVAMLLLARAEALSETGAWRRALADYARLRTDDAITPTAPQRAAATLGTLRALLHTAQIAEALALAETMHAPGASPLTPLLLAAAERSADAEKPDDARSIVSFLRPRIDATQEPAVAEAIRVLESRLASEPDGVDAADVNRPPPDPGAAGG